MYQIKCDDYILYDPRDDDLILLNPKCKLETNTVGGASFSILKTHPHFTHLQKLKSVFEIQQDGQVIFRGRMTEDSRDFHNQFFVDLEGALAFLNDTQIPPFTFPEDFLNDAEYIEASTNGNVVECFLRWVLNQHNSRAAEWQRLKLGNVTVSDPNNYITRTSEKYLSAWEVVKSRLFESKLGGYLVIRYESDGNYVDYLDSFSLTNTQRIVLGENLLDMNSTTSAATTYSAILPFGAESLTLESLPDGNLTDDVVKEGVYIYSKSAREQFGWICAPPDETTWDDVTRVDNLKMKAIEYISGTATLLSNAISIKAVDLSFTDDQIQSFRIYRNIIVNAPAHGVSEKTFPLTKLDIDILNPQNTLITVGDAVRSLVSQNDTQKHTADIKVSDVHTKITEVKKELTDKIESIKIDGIDVDIGGRNFLRNTDPEKWFDKWTAWGTTKIALHEDRWVLVENPEGAASYGVILPKISTIPSAGKYVLSFDAYSDNATQLDYIYIMKDGGNVALKLLVQITSTATRYEIPITLADGCTDCNIMIGTKNGESFYVRDIMLSSGDMATDWVPAPEDFDERLNDSVNVIQQTMLEQRTAVMNDCEKIIMSALESYVETGNYTEFKETVESQLAILADKIEMNFNHTTENINNVAGDLQAEITQRKKHITFSENGINISAGENTMNLELDSGIIKFKRNGVQFGWWDGVDFHTGNIVVEVNKRAQFGNFAFVPRSDGSLMFLKVGG